MRILITGASGMVGKNFCEHPANSQFELLTPSKNELDLLDFSKVSQFIARYRPQVIIHAAGLVGGIQANIREPVRFLMENLDMGRNVVWAAHQAGVKRLINLACACIYPRFGENPLQEESILTGELEPTNEGYALAKITIAKLCTYINREDPSYQYKTLIPCNLYGKYDNFNPAYSHLIPAILLKLHQAKINGETVVEIWGDGEARREFMYVGDLADCIVQAIQHLDTLPDIMNVGMGFDTSINECYQIAAQVVGYPGTFSHNLSKPSGMKQKLLDSSKCSFWDWQASISLKEGLAKTYNFYLQQHK